MESSLPEERAYRLGEISVVIVSVQGGRFGAFSAHYINLLANGVIPWDRWVVADSVRPALGELPMAGGATREGFSPSVVQ